MIFHRRKSSQSEKELLQRAADWTQHTTIESLTPAALRQLAKQEGIDFATALLFDRFRRSSRHADFICQIDKLRECREKSSATLKTKVVLVPGALYLERPDLGGDGRLVRETVAACGASCEVLPLASTGSVAENARRIRQWFLEHANEKIILVSLSKGGKDLSMALSAPDAPAVFHNAVAWINVCGPLNGSFMADWVLSSKIRTCFFRAQFWLQKRDFKFITDLCYESDGPEKNWGHLPPNLEILNIVGFPLRCHFETLFSRFCHRKLSAHGPNDGTILLSDLQAWPGKICPVWGTDHYFRPEALAKEVMAAILRYLAMDNDSGSPALTPKPVVGVDTNQFK